MFHKKLRNLWDSTINEETGNTFSVPEIAVKTGIAVTSWYRYLDGSSKPGAEKLKQLADLFDVSIDYLLNDDIPLHSTDEDLAMAQIQMRSSRLGEAGIQKVIQFLETLLVEERKKVMQQA